MYAVATRAIPVRDTRNIRDLDDVACPAENAVRQRASCSRRCRVSSCESCAPLLTRNLVVLPFLLQLRVLFFSPLLDPEPVYAKHNKNDKSHPSYYSSSNGAYIRA